MTSDTCVSKEEVELLAKLEEQNRLLESDSKSLSSLQSVGGHSRKSSNTSLQSVGSSSTGAGGDRHSPTTAGSDGAQQDTEELWKLWGLIVNDWETYSKKKSSFLKEQVRQGIPHHFRGIVWQLLCNAQECPARVHYAEYMKSTSPCEKVILRDIARTYPEHEFFRSRHGPGQESLFNVMKAYSLYDREVGYCQGSAFIVGLLLLQMPEEEAFCVMVRLMEEYKLREMFKPTMADLGVCMYQLECLVKEQIQDLYLHFQAQGCHTSMYASSWFLTLFTSTFPHTLAARIMDLILSEGMEMVFRVALGILLFCKDDLLQLDMEGMLKFFQKDMVVKCEAGSDTLINFALQVKYNPKKMKKLEKDYTTLKIKEQEDLIELRRLRTENRLLRQRIEHLEQESSSLADRLVQGQVSRAKEAEDNYAIRRELAVLRQQEQSTQVELQRVYQQIRELREVCSQPPSTDSNDDLVRSLQEELVAVKLREAENQDYISRLEHRIQELETNNKRLRAVPPEVTVARLQEELITVKLREAEANLSQKELRHRVKELNALWKRHQKLGGEEGATSSPVVKWWENKSLLPQLQEELKAVQAGEAEANEELKTLHLRLEQLEEQNQSSLHQLQRESEELRVWETRLRELEAREKELENALAYEKERYRQLEATMKEEKELAKKKEEEQTETIAKLQKTVQQLELKNKELEEGKPSAILAEKTRYLNHQIQELQAQVSRLEESNSRLTTALAKQTHTNNNNNNEDSLIHQILDGLLMTSSSSEEAIADQFHLSLDPSIQMLNGESTTKTSAATPSSS